MNQMLRFIIVLTAFYNVICATNEQLEASIKKCKKDNKGYDIQLQIRKWENCVDDSVERFHDSLSSNKKSPYEMLCGNHGMNSCLRNIEDALVRCSEHREIFGFTYNAIYGGLTYLCSDDHDQLANANDVIKECFQGKKSALEACHKDDAMSLNYMIYSKEMC
uniref:DUF19 domain-containing protein n=1 Tax=Strigamia maritima TaxID=126957 RepID=T1JKE1_STRMM